MSDKEKLFALMAIAEEQQAAATKAIEGLQEEQRKFAQQRKAIANLICQLENASTVAARSMERAAGAALDDAADKSINLVARAVSEAFKRSISPVVAELGTIVDHAACAEQRIRSTLGGLTWRSLLTLGSVIIAVLLVIWLGSLAYVSWQRHEIANLLDERTKLAAEVQRLNRQIRDLANRGGRAELASCGKAARLCAQIQTDMGYGPKHDFYILKGY